MQAEEREHQHLHRYGKTVANRHIGHHLNERHRARLPSHAAARSAPAATASNVRPSPSRVAA